MRLCRSWFPSNLPTEIFNGFYARGHTCDDITRTELSRPRTATCSAGVIRDFRRHVNDTCARLGNLGSVGW